MSLEITVLLFENNFFNYILKVLSSKSVYFLYLVTENKTKKIWLLSFMCKGLLLSPVLYILYLPCTITCNPISNPLPLTLAHLTLFFCPPLVVNYCLNLYFKVCSLKDIKSCDRNSLLNWWYFPLQLTVITSLF